MAGAAWATSLSLLSGFLILLTLSLRREVRRDFGTDRAWRPRLKSLVALVALGIPTGLMVAFDIVAMAVFQLIQVRLGPVDGAATQIVMMATSIAYMPAVGIGLAGTTLVGQSIGAGSRDWARRVGNTTITICIVYMTGIAVLLGLSGPFLLPLFVPATDPLAPAVVSLSITLLWIAACYQIFDGMNIAAGFCLRGAGDAKVPAIVLAVVSWLVFLPLAHMLSFKEGEGYVHFLPQFGLGAAGGWLAAVVYVSLLGTILLWRWRSGAWQRMRVFR
jgi:MATE family multidrug resistance protein